MRKTKMAPRPTIPQAPHSGPAPVVGDRVRYTAGFLQCYRDRVLSAGTDSAKAEALRHYEQWLNQRGTVTAVQEPAAYARSVKVWWDGGGLYSTPWESSVLSSSVVKAED